MAGHKFGPPVSAEIHESQETCALNCLNYLRLAARHHLLSVFQPQVQLHVAPLYKDATGSAPVRPKGKRTVIDDAQHTIIVTAVKKAIEPSKDVNLTVFGNVVNRALAKADIDVKNPADIKVIVERLESENIITVEWPTKRLQPAVIRLANVSVTK